MKTAPIFLFVFLLSALSGVLTRSEAQPAGNLRCEYQIAPQGLDVLRPRLSWQWQAAGVWKQQSAYEIIVATSPEKLAQGIGDLWDSAKVISSETSAVYGGRALLTHQRCYWKVRVWELIGPSSPWSEPASWTVGITNQKEWTAQWIGCDKGEPIPYTGKAPDTGLSFQNANWLCAPDADIKLAPVGERFFRREIEIPAGAVIKSAALHVTGDNKYAAFVNGKKVTEGEDWRHSEAADVKKLLVPGFNWIVASYENLVPKGGEGSKTSQGPAGVVLSLDVVLQDGTKLSLVTDGKWESAEDAKAPDAEWKPAKVMGKAGVAPWGKVRLEGVPEYIPATYLRREFTMARLPVRAVLYATAHGIYEMRLNGQRIGDEYFAPGFTDYTKRTLYRTYDVTKMFKTGPNAIGAILGDGWYRGNLSNLGQNRYGSKTRMLAQLYLFFADGRRDVLLTDGDWKANFGPILENDFQAGEVYDARRELTGWDEAPFDDSKWHKPDVGVSFAETTPLNIGHAAPPVRKIAEIKAVSVTQPKPGTSVFDFGQNFAGWARLKAIEKAGTPIVMRFGEMLKPDGSVYRENLRSARATDVYVCKGKGLETWEPRFTYRGFRYVEVEGFAQKPAPDALTGIVAHTDNAQTGQFECSSALLNKIWSGALWSQKSNFLEVPTDCPQRDARLGGTGDAQLFMRTAAYNQDVAAFFTKWIDDLEDAQSPEGAYPNAAPKLHDGWSPGWADAGVIVPWTMWRVYGDTRLIESHFDAMVKHLDYYTTRTPGLLIPNEGLGDQGAPDDGSTSGQTPKTLIFTAYFARSAQLLAEMSAAIGRQASADQYQKQFEEVRKAFQQKFVAPDGKVGSGSQTGYLLALRFNLLTPEQRVKAAALLVKEVEARNYRPSTGVLGMNLLLPTLTDIGRSDVAYRVIQNTAYPSWGYAVEQGATTMWERWDSLTKDKGFGDASQNSFNHLASGSCGEWLYRTVLGIDELEPGFKKILIRPEPGPGVTWARGRYDSVRGPIRTSWKIETGTFKLDVSIPPNTTTEIHVPAASAAISESGRPAAQNRTLKLLREEKNRTVYSAEPGNYSFAVANFASAAL